MNSKDLYSLYKESSGVCTDTRQIKKGGLFFALKGEHFDGNAFAAQALEAGASYAIIDDEKHQANDRCILVPDVLVALQQLALYHRRQFDIPFIAITGSNGKTTTKELVYTVLAKRYKTHATQGNLNNHIGIPLTILSIQSGTEIAIIEMGANHQKEIEQYCLFTEPTHALITNIGKAHLEGFGGLEGVKKGKGELYDYIAQTGGKAFVNSADPIIAALAAEKSVSGISYPEAGDYLHCTLQAATPFVVYLSEDGSSTTTALTGSYNFNNIAAALCVGKYFDVPMQEANQAIAGYRPQNNRSQFVQKGSNQILLDAYNANPSSMRAAIENFHLLAFPQKTIILGDMFELGESSAYEHAALGDLLSERTFDTIILCGKNMKWAAEKVEGSHYFETKEALIAFLQNKKLAGSSILIKGSRGMGLENLLEYLEN
jgi:UDP-N-acetylmuramoyl-tripeptide--D-alanyl-D-alanine ligase